jgi:tRNA-dihydrouridine synthase A
MIADHFTTNIHHAARVSIAPMMDWTDRHCRYFHRVMSSQALLYTEMVTSAAVVRGDYDRLLRYDGAEHPVALQLGGSDPAELAKAVRVVAPYGYDEINLNVGCPSDRVQSGCFGAVLMTRPYLVADCVAAMMDHSPVEVTVKCRIGVDDQTPADVLPDFLGHMADAGLRRVTIHARKAWLQGLSPKENRTIPPLDYGLVYDMKRQFPDLHISINGGVDTLDQAQAHLNCGVDGVMIGRAAYHRPGDILPKVDQQIYGLPIPAKTAIAVVQDMLPYIEGHLNAGGRLHQITRHMLGLFTGAPGARLWRRTLSEGATAPKAGPELVQQALAHITQHAP